MLRLLPLPLLRACRLRLASPSRRTSPPSVSTYNVAQALPGVPGAHVSRVTVLVDSTSGGQPRIACRPRVQFVRTAKRALREEPDRHDPVVRQPPGKSRHSLVEVLPAACGAMTTECQPASAFAARSSQCPASSSM
mmetsp:Transcript_6826/g.21982  ORF Transcript_6826/g.21982 Transcript_6826/m.21982 type:complete len:136 (-) Transcript_6826:308-715(-)